MISCHFWNFFVAFYDCLKIPDPPFNPRCVKSSSDTLAITPIIYLELLAGERFPEGKKEKFLLIFNWKRKSQLQKYYQVLGTFSSVGFIQPHCLNKVLFCPMNLAPKNVMCFVAFKLKFPWLFSNGKIFPINNIWGCWAEKSLPGWGCVSGSVVRGGWDPGEGGAATDGGAGDGYPPPPYLPPPPPFRSFHKNGDNTMPIFKF